MAKRFLKPPRELLTAPRINLRSRKMNVYSDPGALPPVPPVQGLNNAEARVYWALKQLGVQFETQVNILGGSILGGGRADFLVGPPYNVDIEYNGPFHGTSYGLGRDLLRNAGFISLGYRVEKVYERDFPRLKDRLRQILGVPL